MQSRTHALVGANDKIIETREFKGRPPNLAPEKGLTWLPLVINHPVLAAGQRYGEFTDSLANGVVTRTWDVLDPPVPATVSMAQARVALRRAGLLERAEALVVSLGSEARDAWEYSTTVQRCGELTQAIVTGLSLSEAETDDLFRVAAGIVF